MLIIQPPILKYVPEEYHIWADYGIRASTVLLTCKFGGESDKKNEETDEEENNNAIFIKSLHRTI